MRLKPLGHASSVDYNTNFVCLRQLFIWYAFNMKLGNDKISIAITFIIGLLGGFYFFLAGYAPYVEQVKETVYITDQTEIESLIINAEAYGGCDWNNSCASFQVIHDGTFNYLSQPVTAGVVPVTGRLPASLLKRVRIATLPTTLQSATHSSVTSVCKSAIDGIDYNYEIIRNGELYLLDTCTTNLAQTPELMAVLDAVWGYVEQQPE